MSGVVFHNIAEGIMAQSLKLSVTDARDSSSILIPTVKNGNLIAANYVLSHLGFKVNGNFNLSNSLSTPVWGVVTDNRNSLTLRRYRPTRGNTVPDVMGMGARDAVYALESRGIKVRLSGCGKVTEQSLAPGTTVRKGMVCDIILR